MSESISKQFYKVEEHIIQANGLMKALQKIACDDGAEISVMHALDERLKILEQDFHKLWKQQSSDR